MNRQEPGIRVVRTPYEEPYLTHIAVYASNGSFSGETDFYCDVDDLKRVGEALAAFPTKVPDVYEYVYGSPTPTDRFYRYFVIRAKTVDQAGHCALHFAFDLNQEEPNDGQAAFSIPVEPWALAALGRLFLDLHADSTGVFHWAPVRGRVVPVD